MRAVLLVTPPALGDRVSLCLRYIKRPMIFSIDFDYLILGHVHKNYPTIEKMICDSDVSATGCGQQYVERKVSGRSHQDHIKLCLSCAFTDPRRGVVLVQ